MNLETASRPPADAPTTMMSRLGILRLLQRCTPSPVGEARSGQPAGGGPKGGRLPAQRGSFGSQRERLKADRGGLVERLAKLEELGREFAGGPRQPASPGLVKRVIQCQKGTLSCVAYSHD